MAGQRTVSSQKDALSSQIPGWPEILSTYNASNVIQTFTFFKYDWSGLDIFWEGKKWGGGGREEGDLIKNVYNVNRS